MPQSVNLQQTVVHLCLSKGFWGVERYVESVVNIQREQGIHSFVLGNSELESRLMKRHFLLRFGHLGRFIYIFVLRPNVIHTHMTNAEFLGFLVRIVKKTKIVTTRHFSSRRGSNFLGKQFSLIFNRICKNQISISKYVRDSIEYPYSIVIYPGVLNQTKGSPANIKSVAILQRLTIEKHTEIGLQIWAASNLASNGWNLDIYGDGPELIHLVAKTQELGINGSVRFHGKIENKSHVFNNSSVLLATCPREAFGLSTVEAMSFGIPVVAPFAGSSSEVLGIYSSHLTYDHKKPDKAAQILEELCKNATRRIEIGKSLMRLQTKQFSMSNFNKIAKVYFGESV